jgi:hypothetical protein
MPADRERQRQVREAVTQLRARLDEPGNGDYAPFDQAEDLAELLGLVIAVARAKNQDEALVVEVLLSAVSHCREDLAEAEHVMRLLGYREVAPVLRRLGKRAEPRPPSGVERLRIPFHQRIAST